MRKECLDCNSEAWDMYAVGRSLLSHNIIGNRHLLKWKCCKWEAKEAHWQQVLVVRILPVSCLNDLLVNHSGIWSVFWALLVFKECLPHVTCWEERVKTRCGEEEGIILLKVTLQVRLVKLLVCASYSFYALFILCLFWELLWRDNTLSQTCPKPFVTVRLAVSPWSPSIDRMSWAKSNLVLRVSLPPDVASEVMQKTHSLHFSCGLMVACGYLYVLIHTLTENIFINSNVDI